MQTHLWLSLLIYLIIIPSGSVGSVCFERQGSGSFIIFILSSTNKNISKVFRLFNNFSSRCEYSFGFRLSINKQKSLLLLASWKPPKKIKGYGTESGSSTSRGRYIRICIKTLRIRNTDFSIHQMLEVDQVLTYELFVGVRDCERDNSGHQILWIRHHHQQGESFINYKTF
jgi:hypothetical protein